jgi:hypothetical protein
MTTPPVSSSRRPGLPPAPDGRLVEAKERLDGTASRFDLERWLVTPELVVGRWIAGAENAFGAAEDTYSWGVWWPHRPIGVYRLHAADGALLFYRVDAVEDVRVSEGPASDGEVRYRDLLLDARIQPEGEVSFEDEDEVAEAVSLGRLTRAQLWRIDWVRGVVGDRSSEVRGWADRAIAHAITEAAGGVA